MHITNTHARIEMKTIQKCGESKNYKQCSTLLAVEKHFQPIKPVTTVSQNRLEKKNKKPHPQTQTKRTHNKSKLH